MLVIGDEVMYKGAIYSVVFIYQNGYMEIKKLNSLQFELAAPDEVTPT